MSREPPLAVPELGIYRLEVILKGDVARGCGRGIGPRGESVFVRWQSLAEPEDELGPVTEFECLSSVGDVGVPAPLDLVWTSSHVAVIAEWIDGVDLLTRGDRSPDQVCAAVGRAISKAHAAGWTHGDVKPSNILVSRDGERVALVDWELARRHGEPAPPGTAGWAPPEAWDNGHVATPASDVYALGVVLWELITRRRAFAGSLADILDQQRRFSFEGASGTSLLTAALEAARRRLSVIDVPSNVMVAGTTPAVLSSCLARSCSGPARRVLAERVRGRRSCWTLAEVMSWIDTRHGASATAGDLDAQRAGWIRVAREIMLGLAGTVRPLLVRSTAEANQERRLRAALASQSRLEFAVEDATYSPTKRLSSREYLRQALQICLGSAEVPEDAVRLLGQFEHEHPSTIVEYCCRLVQAGALYRHDGIWRTDADRAPDGSTVCRALQDDASGARDADLCAAEHAVVLGDVRVARRLVTAATRRVTENPQPSASDIARAIGIWFELGSFGVCRQLLTKYEAVLPRAYRVGSMARIALAIGSEDLRSEALAAGEPESALPDDRMAIARLQAVRCLTMENAGEAVRVLRRSRPYRRRASPFARLETGLVVANARRLRGRAERALETLQRLETAAVEHGAIRLLVAIRINRVLASVEASERSRADAWETIVATACGWGLSQYAAYATAMAGRLWLSCGDPERARRVLGMWRASVGSEPPAEGHASVRLACLSAALSDWDERPSEAMHACDGARNAELRARALLLKLEFQGTSLPSVSRQIGNARDGVLRSVRAVTRAAGRQSCSSKRAARVLAGVETCAVSGTGIAVHAARVLVRACALDMGAVRDQLQSAAGRQFDAGLLLGVHAVAFAWFPRRISDRDARWFSEHAPTEAGRRPVGVREWEWAAAHATCEAQLNRVEASAQFGSAATTCLETLLRGLPAPYLEPYASRARGALAGCPRETAGTAVDAAALQARVRELERMLRSALRLRSSTSVDEVLAEAVMGVLDVTSAERAVILFDLGSGGVKAKLGTPDGVSDLPLGDTEISHSVLARVRDAKEAVVIDDAAAEESLGDRPSVRKYRPRSVMVCPLRTPTRYLGYMYVENRSRPRSFGGTDPEMLEGFASQAALALENAALVEDLRASYRDLSSARSEAVRAESLRALGRMATEVAHDLNNLLTAVMGEAQLLLADARFRDAYASLRVIERAAQDGAECIRRIQDSTRQRPAAEFEEVDIVRIVRDVLEFTRVRCAPKPGAAGSGIRVAYSAPRSVIVRGVASELREVFTNLIVNAIEAMEKAGGRLDVRVAADVKDVNVSIEDTGCGIAPAVLSRLFEPFFTTKGEKGNGLGLSIAQGVIRRHGGDVTVKSREGVGTVFVVRVPRVHVDIQLDEVSASTAPDSRSQARKRFLIIDDDASVLRVLEQMLSQAGAEVESVVGGDAAVAKLELGETKYDCVITDLYMPRVSGLDVADCVRRRTPTTPIVVMSGCATTLESESTRARGITQVIRKPFALDVVRRLVAATA